jgi:hypothetical protein
MGERGRGSGKHVMSTEWVGQLDKDIVDFCTYKTRGIKKEKNEAIPVTGSVGL